MTVDAKKAEARGRRIKVGEVTFIPMSIGANPLPPGERGL